MIVVVGEALIDVVVDAEGGTSETPGGSPLNVAVGLARLGVPARLVTQIGHDSRGSLLVRHLESSGAVVSAHPTSTGRTSVATAHLDPAGAARYDFDLEWSLPPQDLPATHLLQVGSLGALLDPGSTAVLDLVEQALARGVPVSYDVNLRESFVDDRERVQRLVTGLATRCTVVKLSDEDAAALDPGRDPIEVARSLLGGEHTRLVLLTAGAEGATALAQGVEVSARPRPVEVVDTVGAGDAFMAATLAQLHEIGAYRAPRSTPTAKDLERILRGAGEVAAITCERRGANPPRREELPGGWPG
jgi:fructokinase